MARNVTDIVARVTLAIAVAAVSNLVSMGVISNTLGWAATAADGDQEKTTLGYGVYDPEERFSKSDRIAVEHVFVRWGGYDRHLLRAAFEYAAARNRWLMITVEPWGESADRNRGGAPLFDDITSGVYDQQISAVCGDLGAFQAPIFVRWGHEMEVVSGRYPWAQDDADGYIKAYRYFVDHCRKLADRSLFVWSPKGEPQMSHYYPGPDYVDFIGLSVFGLQDRDVDKFGPLFFDDLFRSSYTVASRYNKAIMVAELGVHGDDDYRREWMSQVARSRRNFPLLRLVVYFNAKEPQLLRRGGMPDWRIDPRMFPPPVTGDSSH
jgi:endoglucanase